MSLTYTLDWAEFQIRKDSKGENALVKKRVAKLCKDILALKPYVMNIPTHTDFIGICKTRKEFSGGGTISITALNATLMCSIFSLK